MRGYQGHTGRKRHLRLSGYALVELLVALFATAVLCMVGIVPAIVGFVGVSNAGAAPSAQEQSSSSARSSNSAGVSASSPSAGRSSGSGDVATDAAGHASATRSLQRVVESADGTTYKVKVTFDEAAGIPDDAALSVVEYVEEPSDSAWESDPAYKDRPTDTEKFVRSRYLADHSAVVNKTLKVEDDDFVYFTKFLDLAIVSEGEVVKPSDDIEVVISTDAVEPAASQGVELAMLADDDEMQADARATKEGLVTQDGKTARDLEAQDVTGEDAGAAAFGDAGEAEAGKESGGAEGRSAVEGAGAEGGAGVSAVSGAEGADGSDGAEGDEGEFSTFAFSTDGLAELALVGIAEQKAILWQDDVHAVEVLGPRAVAASAHASSAPQLEAGEGREVLGAYSFDVEPERDGDTMLWLRDGASSAQAPTSAQRSASTAVEACVVEGGRMTGAPAILDAGWDPMPFNDGQTVALVMATAAPVPTPDADSDDAEAGLEDDDADVDDEAGADDDAEGDGSSKPGGKKLRNVKRTAEALDAELEGATLTHSVSALDGSAYEVSVSYGPEAGIASDAKLQVSEFSEIEYDFYAKRARQVLGGARVDYTRGFDVAIVDFLGREIQPAAPVTVSIALEDGIALDDAAIVHFAPAAPSVIEPDVQEASAGSIYQFTTESFSPYLVAGTVREHVIEPADDRAYEVSVTSQATDVTSQATDDSDDSDNPILAKQLLYLEGNWATWSVNVNPDGRKLNDGANLTLEDTFALIHKDESGNDVSDQSIDYASIKVTSEADVSYDYRSNTGTFIIPDATPAVISYRTRITSQPGEEVTFGYQSRLLGQSSRVIAETANTRTEVIYPSASDVATTTGDYMVKLFVYANGQMQTGISGAEFILLDANVRPVNFTKGEKAGTGVVFTTDDAGYANVHLDAADGGVAIEKNTAYYLEMIKAPEGFKRDSTLYNFMITDDPGYESGGVWTYYNGDTMKVRLFPEEASLNVSMRFSGNYALTTEWQNGIKVILQKKNEEGWEEVERHPYTDFTYGSLTFNAGEGERGLEEGATYRVIQEGARPWDLDASIDLITTYYLIVGSESNIQDNSPVEFTVGETNKDSSFNVVISNEYERHELSIIKMNKETGEKLPGAEFTVRRVTAAGDVKIKEVTTDSNGALSLSGGDEFESEALYYVVETKAPEGYLLPIGGDAVENRIYFYFCNDPGLEQSILAQVPEGKTAVNLTSSYSSMSLDNQPEQRTVRVMKTWQGNTWPDTVGRVVVGLYQSVDGSAPTPVVGTDGAPRTVVLTKSAPFNDNAFANLPTRDDQNRNVIYSIKEEHVYATSAEGDADVIENYVQEYGISDAGVYVVRNRPSASLTVRTEWYDASGSEVTDPETLARQSDVTFDVYQTTGKVSDDVRADGVMNEELEALIDANGWVKVRSGLHLGANTGWSATVSDLPFQDDLDQPYYYYVHEMVPSFGDEVYELDEDHGTVLIKNKISPETVTVTVAKAALVDDPRESAKDTDFTFTLALNKGVHPIREYEVYSQDGNSLETDWNGEVTFTLKATQDIKLTLPKGVTATVTEEDNAEYVEKATSTLSDLNPSNDRAFKFDVNDEANNATVTFTNTLRVVCMVVDVNGNEHPFESFKSTLAHVRANPGLYAAEGPIALCMLEDYVMPATDVFDVREGENFMLTTATTDANAKFYFRTDRVDEHVDTAVIARGGKEGSLLTNAGELALGKVTLDGSKDAHEVNGDGGLVHSTGALSLGAGTTLRNSSASGKGGAIYSEGDVDMDGGSITGNKASTGSAVYLKNCTLTMTSGKIEGNVSTSGDGGALAVSSTDCRIRLSGNPVIFDNYNEAVERANISLDVDSDHVIDVIAPGLSENAHIGVRAMIEHREINEVFATAAYGYSQHLDCFVNDDFGYRGKPQDGYSMNVVWDGFVLTLSNVFTGQGSNPHDTFTITITSSAIKKNSYLIDGNTDNMVTAARRNAPGTIELRSVKPNDVISISPLPMGEYTIAEGDSNYTASYSGENKNTGSELTIEDGTFSLLGDSDVTVSNTRKRANVELTKTLVDKLMGSESVGFSFDVTLVDADGTPLSGFNLDADASTNPAPTDVSGKTNVIMTPANNSASSRSFQAPVGAVMTIAEVLDPDYTMSVSGVTAPAEGSGAPIADADVDNDNAFAFPVTNDGARITFENVRKMAGVELRKELVGKVSKTETYTFTVTLLREDGEPAAHYAMRDDVNQPIVTDGDGKVEIPFQFDENDELAKSVILAIPDGTELKVEETDAEGRESDWYEIAYSINGDAAISAKAYENPNVTDELASIVFRNVRKMRTVTVTNTVNGYSGNVAPFTYTATVQDEVTAEDGGVPDYREPGYNDNGFSAGKQTFELTTGQSRALTVPYGANLNITQAFAVGYEPSVKHGENDAVKESTDRFDVKENVTVAFTNNQLINIVLVNDTSHNLEGVRIYTEYGTTMYRVHEDGNGWDSVDMSDHVAAVDIDPGKTAMLEVNHVASRDAEQVYKVSGDSGVLASGYLHTIRNEPSYHEFANPAVLRVYDDSSFEVQGKLRYSVADSTITFTEQPLVSFDANGGVWTTEMEGYRDRDGDRQVYQMAVDTGEPVSQPDVDPIYPTGEGIEFLGWTTDESFAKGGHGENEDISSHAYNFADSVDKPQTLYAVWSLPERDTHTVTVTNGVNDNLSIEVTLEGEQASGIALAAGIETDATGKATLTLAAKGSINLAVPKGENTKLVLVSSTDISCLAYSEVFSDGDGDNASFTINPVKRDGTVSFIGGRFKITDADGNILYDEDGNPAVYMNLRKNTANDDDEAFDAYEKNVFYADSERSAEGTPAMIKQLVGEYAVTKVHDFPSSSVTFTTARSNDADFPYVGIRTRATAYRSDNFVNGSLFTLTRPNADVTLANMVFDGKNIGVKNTVNGGLVSVTSKEATLTVNDGTTMRNVQFETYNNANGGWGGAVYVKDGTMNVTAGLFSNLKARCGGAICVRDGKLKVVGQDGSTQFENCKTDAHNGNAYGGDGGAICYVSANEFVVDGGKSKGTKPGIIFTGCVASANRGDGGAIYSDTNGQQPVSISGCEFIECSSKNEDTASTKGYGGGAIDAWNVVSLTVKHCTFNACDTLNGGGAIGAYVTTKTEETENDGVSIDDCSFERCNCKGQGGALAIYQDDNGATTSTTKLVIARSSFKDCSSGTNNGSGGAIQCYLPRMVFSDTSFMDCWAGKEGGAVNNFFGNNYTQDWPKSSTKLEKCTFIRCRAEDRYDQEGNVRYGGGVNTKANKVEVTGCKFEDCVSTLKEGGALHLGGKGDDSKATLTDNVFRNCAAKSHGGALLSSHEELVIENTAFYGCSSSGNGGAVCHYRNNHGDSTQKTLLISNCTFSEDPDAESGLKASCSAAGAGGAVWTSAKDSVKITVCTINGTAAGTTGGAICTQWPTDVTIEGSDIAGCEASGNGGAVWTQGKNVSIIDCAISKCIAGGDGGGLYLNKNGNDHKATVSETSAYGMKGSIIACEAMRGSAVYTNGNVVFSNANIVGNEVTSVGSAAIHGETLYFEGDVKVENNTCTEDKSNHHDVLLQSDNAKIINTTEHGLGDNAHVGVYVIDTYYAKRGLEGLVFATRNSSDVNFANVDHFFNDRNADLFGYMAKPEDLTICWGTYLCKITDEDGNTLTRSNGRDAVYQRLTMALDDFSNVDELAKEKGSRAAYVKMLVEEYNLLQNGSISNFPAGKSVILTTATVDAEPDGKHPYRGAPSTVCTITRDTRFNNNNELFTLNAADTVFTLENITLDGRKDKAASQGNFRLITANGGKVVVNGGTTFQYGYASGGNGGAAIQLLSNVQGLEIHSSENHDVVFDHCVHTNNDYGGGAIYSVNSVAIDQTDGKGKTYFLDCNARRGGAIMVNKESADVKLLITGAEFKNCYSWYEGGAVYHNNKNPTKSETAISGCVFENCYTITDAQWSYGGAVDAKTAFLKVEDCAFNACYALSNGGAVNHGSNENNRIQTTIIGTTFSNCKTVGNHEKFGFGGSVFTSAKQVDIDTSLFEGSASYNSGGALYCNNDQSGSATSISGTTFNNCSVSRDEGSGGAIYSKGLTLTLKNDGETNSVINGCTAPLTSGAVHMEKEKSNLIISDDTVVSGCYAKKGGALYLKKNVTLTIEGSPEFTRNGYTANGLSAEEGACIFLEEDSRVNLSGTPKFSRNNITNVDRVVNGGVTDYVRQDIYLAGYKDKKRAVSIYVAGELDGDTIWIWPAEKPHRLPSEQFAETAESVSNASLQKLRNALADGTTGCSKGEYLAGERLGDSKTDIYWSKMYDVTFRKVDNKAVGVPGAEFTLYSDKDCKSALVAQSSADGANDTSATGELLRKGDVDFASVPIGIYYMKETRVPDSFDASASEQVYLVLVGTPSLSPNDSNAWLWKGDGPLNVEDAANLVAQRTTNEGKYFGIFALENGKADLSKNLAAANVGIVNVRVDFDAWFMKVDSYGNPLPGAAFTIYEQVTDARGEGVTIGVDRYPDLTPWSRDGEIFPDSVTSADGSNSYKRIDGTTVDKGLVYFRELPIGTYYLMETYYPERNGDNRRAFFVEEDRVFKLTVNGSDDFKLEEWNEGGSYTAVERETGGDGRYVVRNKDAVCKLTDMNDSLLYGIGHDGKTRIPAVYATLEEGFAAAQTDTFYTAGNMATGGLKLKVLKDFVLSHPFTYNSSRQMTFTTAERTATAADRYVFSTTRTTDVARAEIKRDYDEGGEANGGSDALITISDGASFTLQNINLNGQKSSRSGRAIHVRNGSLNILSNTQLQNFKHTLSSDDAGNGAVRGGAVLLNDGTMLTVDGGTANRSAVFSGNEVSSENGDAFGGALAVGKGCAMSFANAQFTGNKATASSESEGNGGAIGMGKPKSAGVDGQADVSFANVVFRNNSASGEGGALYASEASSLAVENSIFTSNRAEGAGGGALAVLAPASASASLAINGTTFTSNSAENGKGGVLFASGIDTMRVDGSSFKGNIAGKDGGALFTQNAAELVVEGGSFADNTARDASGGAIAAYFSGISSSLAVNGSAFTTNAAGANGGAIATYVSKGSSSLAVNGSAFTTNAAGANGGAIYTSDATSVNLSGANFDGNHADGGNGGAVAASSESADSISMVVSGGDFKGNSAKFNGGAIEAGGKAELKLADDVQIHENFARHGGAVATAPGVGVSVDNGALYGNSASGNGGAFFIGGENGAEGSLHLKDSAVTNNSAGLGSAVFASDYAKIAVDDSAITDNRATGLSGGAINAQGNNDTLRLGGSTVVYDNKYGNQDEQRNVVLSATTNTNGFIWTTEGGLAEDARIGVYVVNDLYNQHGLSGRPFGTFASNRNLQSFKNDRNPALYGVRSEDDAADNTIYWINFGVPVAFGKIDNNGNALPGAAFTLYLNMECTEVFTQASGEIAQAVSADGVTAMNSEGQLLKRGVVLFEEIPDGVYYMKERYADASSGAPAGFGENVTTYIVLAGEGALTRPDNAYGTIWSEDDVLAEISQEMVYSQRSRYSESKDDLGLVDDAQYAIFAIDGDGVATAVPNIAASGIMNIPENDSKVVLKKVESSGAQEGAFVPLAGAVFDLLRFDRTVVASGLTSDSSGLFFIGTLPEGTYYLHETTVPEGHVALSGGDNWFRLTVDADGAQPLESLTEAP